MKVLIITRGAWRDDNNTGNTFTNLFHGWNKNDLANIYISPEYPSNNVCEKYFQINDKMLFLNIIRKERVGKEFNYSSLAKEKIVQAYEKIGERKLYDFARIYRLQLFFLIRELLWKIAKWDNYELYSFVKKFSPDLIFAPLFDSHYTNNLSRHLAQITGKKVVTFIADDLYTYKQFSLSPLYWINRYFLRKNLEKTINLCERVYIMAPMQKAEYDPIFNINSKLLLKGGNFSQEPVLKTVIQQPIKLVYTGNIFAGRWKMLGEIAKALSNINKDGIKAQLYIYTQNPMSPKMEMALKYENSSFIMGAISFNKVKEVLGESDIVVHVESLQLKYRLLTRLSFSTKIVDYLESGRCIFAIGSEDAASIDYLRKNNAAVIANRIKDIEPSLRNLFENPQKILEQGKIAWKCGKENHEIKEIRRKLKEELNALVQTV